MHCPRRLARLALACCVPLVAPAAADAAQEDRQPPPTVSAAIWAAGWGLPYAPGHNAMSLTETDPGTYTVGLYDDRAPTVPPGTGEWIEFSAYELDRGPVHRRPGAPISVLYIASGVLFGEAGWSAPLHALVVEFSIGAPGRTPERIDGVAIVPLGIDPTVREADQSARDFAVAGGPVQPGSKYTPRTDAAWLCQNECWTDQQTCRASVTAARNERDAEAESQMEWHIYGCFGIGGPCFIAGPLGYVACTLGCGYFAANHLATQLANSASELGRDLAACGESYSDCMREQCGVIIAWK